MTSLAWAIILAFVLSWAVTMSASARTHVGQWIWLAIALATAFAFWAVIL